MKLRDIVVEEAVLPELQATDRDAAIAEILDALVAGGAVSPELRDEFHKSIVKREKRGSTGFGHGVAVPHIKHPAIERMIVAIAVSSSGVEFNALDKKPVHSIFLLLSPEDRPEDHLDAMNAIFGNLQNETFRRFLRQARQVENVLMLLDEADAKASLR